MRDHPQAVPTMSEICDWLDHLAMQDSRCAIAVGILRGRRGGRRTINDVPALARMADLLEENPSISVESAARRIALTIASPHSHDSATIRLARKYRRYFSNKTS